ncbi:MAG: adenosylcobalamin-dependent ribonucleoside-diphosphate reductase [Nanoarchaeota archaeon]
MEQTQDIITEKRGLEISRYFTKEGTNPFDLCIYEERSSVIKNPDGSIIFQMDNVEVPRTWSQVATDILAQKYFRKTGVPLKNRSGEPLLDENGKIILGSETSIKQVAHRIAGCWRYWGEKHNYFASKRDADIFYDEMVFMIINQYAAPNSPQWFTTGLNWAYGHTGLAQGHSYINPVTKQLEYSQDAYTRSQPHACFIQHIDDDLVKEGGIFSLLVREARVFKYGGGTGSNFSQLRGKGENLSGGGASSGLMSFLKIFDAAAGSVKSGGTTRRAAKMVCLDLDHPEIEEFIWWKVKEEEKVAGLVAGSKILKEKITNLIEAAKNKENPLEDKEVQRTLREAAAGKIPLNYLVRALDLTKQGRTLPLREFDTHYESEAYVTVSGQNSNNSVRIPNAFFECLNEKKDWKLKARRTGETLKVIPAEKLWNDIGYCAWASADPGVQYDTTINEWHTCPAGGRINSSNPCSEYMFLDDTACNLASLNLIKFYDENKERFDVQGYRQALRLWTIALEISVLMAHFPSEEIARKSYEYRTLGLGFANIGALLMIQGVPYDSDKGRTISAALAAIMTGESYATSAEMAGILGTFERFEENKEAMLRVIRNHRRAAYGEKNYETLQVKPIALDQYVCPVELLEAARNAWDRALRLGEQKGFRNAQVTVIAPTGTIGLVMDCDTTGIEPDYALVKHKKLAGGGFFKIVNQSVPKSLKRLGYDKEQIKEIIIYCLGHGSLEKCPTINPESLLNKGLRLEEIKRIDAELKNAVDIRYPFNRWTLGEETYCRIMQGKSVDLLTALGYSSAEIDLANEYVCGTNTIEGAPHLKDEHYPVFDCANNCGKKGKRFIHPYGHLKMVAAVQPFISGAISKTVNMPREWNIEQIKKVYYDAWTMMIKGVALYRDGCKLSQPLTSNFQEHSCLTKILQEKEEKKETEKTVKEIIRKKVKVGAKTLTLSANLNSGKVTDISYNINDLSLTQQLMMNALVNTISLGLGQGLKPGVIANNLKLDLNLEGHPLISELQSFLQEFEEESSYDSSNLPKSVVIRDAEIKNPETKTLLQKKCSSCGAAQLRQNGTCMLCEVCGETTGCS